MEKGTLDFLASHRSWKAVYRSRVRPTDEISKFLTFATILDKEVERKIPDLLVELGVEKTKLKKARDSVGMVLDKNLKKAVRKAVTSVPRGLRRMILAYVMRNAMIVSEVPLAYDPSTVEESRTFKTAGRLRFQAKHKLWDKTIELEIEEGDHFRKFIEFAARIDDEVLLKLPFFFDKLGVDISRFEGMIDETKKAIDPGLGKKVMDTLPFVMPEVRGLAGAYAVRAALAKKKIPYEYRTEKIKKLVKEL